MQYVRKGREFRIVFDGDTSCEVICEGDRRVVEVISHKDGNPRFEVGQDGDGDDDAPISTYVDIKAAFVAACDSIIAARERRENHRRSWQLGQELMRDLVDSSGTHLKL